MPSARRDDFLHSAQALRVPAVLAVIVIHAAPFDGAPQGTALRELSYLLNDLARFAIPFFFILSGHLFARSAARRGEPEAARRSARRLSAVLLVWSAVYALLPHVKDFRAFGYWGGVRLKTVDALLADPLSFLLQGPGTHLWYVVSLLTVLGAVRLLSRRRRRLLLPTALALYALCLLGGTYTGSPLGLALPVEAKLGPLGGLLLFTLGMRQDAAFARSESARVHGLLIFGGLGLIVIEMTAARLLWSTPQQDFFLGSVPVAVGMLRWCLAGPDRLRRTVLPRWGGLTLGVYVLHPALMRIPRLAAFNPPSAWWQLGQVALLYAASLALCLLLARSKRFSPLVR